MPGTDEILGKFSPRAPVNFVSMPSISPSARGTDNVHIPAFALTVAPLFTRLSSPDFQLASGLIPRSSVNPCGSRLSPCTYIATEPTFCASLTQAPNHFAIPTYSIYQLQIKNRRHFCETSSEFRKALIERGVIALPIRHAPLGEHAARADKALDDAHRPLMPLNIEGP